MAALSRREPRTVNTWPGFVDALASLLMVVVFLVLMFVIAQVFLNEALTGRDAALETLRSRVSELSELLGLERQANTDLRANLEQVSADLQASITERHVQETRINDLREQAGAAEAWSSTLAVDLARLRQREVGRIAELDDLSAALLAERERTASLTQAAETAAVEASRTTAALADLAGRRDEAERRIAELIASLEAATARAGEAEARATATAGDLEQARGALEQSRAAATAAAARADAATSAAAELQRRLDATAETIRVDRATIEMQTGRLAQLVQQVTALEALKAELEADTARLATGREETDRALTEQQRISQQAQADVALLNRQIAALREQITALVAALDASEATVRGQSAAIEDLGSRLNAALASRVQDLSRYRSEFFGRLREVLGEQEGVRIVGDRFVFQSEVLFGSGSAVLDGEGRSQLLQVAATLIKLAEEIPEEIDWVLQVNGHTDRVPVGTASPYASNWQLSTERALSVVALLTEAGIPPTRLAAAGFGENRPLDPADGATAYQRNRRIELKLTQP